MRSSILALLMGMWFCLRAGPAHAQPSHVPVITIRVHDYARLPIEFINRAQRHVTDLYTTIGVRTIDPAGLQFEGNNTISNNTFTDVQVGVNGASGNTISGNTYRTVTTLTQ